MRFILDKDHIILEKLTNLEMLRVRSAFYDREIYDLPDEIFKPKISLKLRDELLELNSELFGFKKGINNYFFILKDDKIVKEKVKGKASDFAKIYISEAISDILIKNILTTYIIKEVNIEGKDLYATKRESLIDEDSPLNSLQDWSRLSDWRGNKMVINDVDTSYIAFNIINDKFYSYTLYNKMEGDSYLHGLKPLSMKKLSNQEKSNLLNHIKDINNKSEYYEELF